MQTKKTHYYRKATPRGLAVCLFALSLVVVACSDDEPAGPPPVPTVSSISSTSVAPGDTVTIRGADFASPARDNRVYFHNPLEYARPYSGSATSLTVVVPYNAADGRIRVTVPDQPEAGVGPEMTVNRGVGDVWVFGGVGAGYALSLPFPASDTEYLLIPYSATPGVPFQLDNGYTINEEAGQASPSPVRVARASGTSTGRERFDQRFREALEWLIEHSDGTERFRTEREVARSPQAPAQFRQFYVLNTANPNENILDPKNYDRITAKLRYDGDHCLIYNDVDTLATGNLEQADYDSFGWQFDNEIFPTDSLYFGVPSDIDGNGKVIILVSGIINGLPATDPTWVGNYFIGGFFAPVDLFHPGEYGLPAGVSNEAEIFYVLAADNGEYLDGYHFDRAYVAQENPKTITHEFEHLISNSFRIFNYGLPSVQSTWLEEGMAHMAEDLNDINDSNHGRANYYLEDPGAISLEDDDAPLEQRGGAYLFLRYLGDRFGEDIYRRIIQYKCLGRQCIERITGENFYVTVGDFLATLYLSGKGITSDEKYNYAGIDLGTFDPVLVNSHAAVDGEVGGTVRRASGDFHLYENTSTTPGLFTFGASSKAGLRTVVVRTR
jgi:hypothetical protein